MSENNPEGVVNSDGTVDEVDSEVHASPDVPEQGPADPEVEESVPDEADAPDEDERDAALRQKHDDDEAAEQARRQAVHDDTDYQRELHREQAAAKATAERQFNQPPAPEDSSDSDSNE